MVPTLWNLWKLLLQQQTYSTNRKTLTKGKKGRIVFVTLQHWIKSVRTVIKHLPGPIDRINSPKRGNRLCVFGKWKKWNIPYIQLQTMTIFPCLHRLRSSWAMCCVTCAKATKSSQKPRGKWAARVWPLGYLFLKSYCTTLSLCLSIWFLCTPVWASVLIYASSFLNA